MRDDIPMRTTLDIDDDVLMAVKDLSRHRRATIGSLVSDLVRKALVPPTADIERDGVPLFPSRTDGEIVSLELVNRLRDETP